jgi:hypothetical protein
MALNSQGSRIKHASSGVSPSVYTAIEEVVSINGPDGTANLIDVSHLQSTRKEYLQGLADNGSISLECNFTGGTKQMELYDLFNNTSDAEEYKLEIPSSSAKTNFHTFVFDAIVTKWSVAPSTDDKVKLSITLQTTGGVSYLGVI